MLIESGKSKPNSSIAAEEIRKLIFSGKLGAGTDHLESELAETLGMSRTPVREAVLMLQAQGLLEVRPRKGVRIKPVSPADMREIYDILTELESLSAADAARQGYGDEDLKGLKQAIDQMDAALDTNDLDGWAVADEAFHKELVRLGGNSRVALIVAMMSDQVRRARAVTLYMRPPPKKSNEDHRKVLQAIREGQPDNARTIHREHRTSAKQILIDLLGRYNLNSL